MLHQKFSTEMLLYFEYKWSRGGAYMVIGSFQDSNVGVIRNLLWPQLLYSVKDVSLGLRVVRLRCSKNTLHIMY